MSPTCSSAVRRTALLSLSISLLLSGRVFPPFSLSLDLSKGYRETTSFHPKLANPEPLSPVKTHTLYLTLEPLTVTCNRHSRSGEALPVGSAKLQRLPHALLLPRGHERRHRAEPRVAQNLV